MYIVHIVHGLLLLYVTEEVLEFVTDHQMSFNRSRFLRLMYFVVQPMNLIDLFDASYSMLFDVIKDILKISNTCIT